jgi:predicted hotdog family 3-hydroxylacyl-ACP dehydratase
MSDAKQYLPHKEPMVLLSGFDESSVTETGLTAFVDIKDRDLFFDAAAGGVPGCVALEYMAQTVACFAGVCAAKEHKPPLIGLVLGSRRLDIHVPFFKLGVRYTITSKLLFTDEAFASFDVSVNAPDGSVAAQCILSCYQPETGLAFFSRPPAEGAAV